MMTQRYYWLYALWYVTHLQVHFKVTRYEDVFNKVRENRGSLNNASILLFELDCMTREEYIRLPVELVDEYFALPMAFRLATID
jgi:hypothetical protein